MGDDDKGRNYGFKPDKYDANDLPYGYKGEIKKPLDVKSVNLLKDYDNWLSPVYNQYGSNSCTANATAAAIRFTAWKVGWEHQSVRDPSRLFIYYHARALETMEAVLKDDPQKTKLDWPDKVIDDGASIRYALKSLKLLGIAPESAQPFLVGNEPSPKFLKIISLGSKEVILSTNDRPRDIAYLQAKDLSAFEYCRLDPDHPPEEEDRLTSAKRREIGALTLQRLKQSLVERYPVIFGHAFYSSQLTAFELANQKQPYPTLKPIPKEYKEAKPTKWTHGKHTILAVGFQHETNSPEIGKVLVQNSWGSEFNVNVNYHHYWIPYEYITNYWASEDFWMIRPLDTKAPPPGLKLDLRYPKIPPVKLLSPWTANILDSKNDNWAMEPASTIATVVRSSTHVELAWISDQGTIRTARLTNKWSTNAAIPKGTAARGAIAAALVDPSIFELYWITTNGEVQGWRWPDTDKKGKPLSMFTITTGPDSASPRGGIAAVGSGVEGDAVGVWWVARDGSVKGAWSDTKTSSWARPYELTPAGKADWLSSIAAVSLGENRLQVFWISPEGNLTSQAHRSSNSKGWDSTPTKITSGAATQSRIAAVARKSTIDVFFITPSGAIKHWIYSSGLLGGWSEDKGFTLRFSQWLDSDETESSYTLSIARLDSDIKAVSVNEDRIDLYWVGPDNSIRSARGVKGTTSVKWTHSLLAGSGQAMPGSPLGVYRVGDRVSVSFRSHLGEIVVADTIK